MKTVLTFFAIVFLSFQVVGQGDSPTSKNKVDPNDLAHQIMNKINVCESMTCFVDFYNRFAKVTSGFSNRETGKGIMVEILKLMDKKRPGLLFDLYMKSDKKYQNYFIECVKMLPKNLREDMVRKAKAFQKNN